MSRLEKALKFAVSAHSGQVRKYTAIPYVTHPIAVMEIVSTVEHSEDMLIAALLHDVVEDTDYKISDIHDEWGSAVAEMVMHLTDVSKPSDGNRAARKLIDRKHLANAPDNVKTIKLADLIHNSESIIANDPKFAGVYMKEKVMLLTALKGGDPKLMERAENIVSNYIYFNKADKENEV